MATKPKIKRGPASVYAGENETIVEFSHYKGGKLLGGLIAIRACPDGELSVHVYRTDPGVVVYPPEREYPEEQLQVMGELLAQRLAMRREPGKRDSKGRRGWRTGWGWKTGCGLVRMLRDTFSQIERGRPPRDLLTGGDHG